MLCSQPWEDWHSAAVSVCNNTDQPGKTHSRGKSGKEETNCFLTGFEACSEVGKSRLVLQTCLKKKSMAGEVIGSSREATAIVLLSEHYFILYKWRYPCLYLCSQTSTIVSFGQRNFFSRRELVTAESHSWSKCREWMTVECLAINGTSSISPHPTPKNQQ